MRKTLIIFQLIVCFLNFHTAANNKNDRVVVEKDEQILRQKNNFDWTPFGNSDSWGNPFEQMRDLMNRMMFGFDKSFFGDRKNSFFEGGERLKTNHSENDQYKFITIESDGLNKDGINIKIEKGIVIISGEIRRTHTEGDSQSVFINSFRESFNVPQGVNVAKVELEYVDNKIIIKFPKI